MFENLDITIIVAMSNNNVIGYKNKLPWHLPKDLAHFKKYTAGKNIIMGRKTYQSIFSYINKPLPDRNSFIITNSNLESKYIDFDYVKTFKSLDDFNNHFQNQNFNISSEICVIGGEQIYKQMIEYATKLVISHVNINCEGDAFFPYINENIWQVEDENPIYNTKNELEFSIKTYIKK